MRKPYHKPTKAEQAERVQLTSGLLAGGFPKAEIKRLLRERYGVEHRTAERYLARARGELIERSGRPANGHRLDAYSLYHSVIRDPKATTRELLLAQKRIDKLLGLDVRAR